MCFFYLIYFLYFSFYCSFFFSFFSSLPGGGGGIRRGRGLHDKQRRVQVRLQVAGTLSNGHGDVHQLLRVEIAPRRVALNRTCLDHARHGDGRVGGGRGRGGGGGG